jgi:transcriptional regulator with XRE-family HTH domain
MPEGIWRFPMNLADEANVRGESQKRVAEITGVSQPTVSRWLAYNEASLRELLALNVVLLENEWGLAPGALLMPFRTAAALAAHQVALEAMREEPGTLEVVGRASKPQPAHLVEPEQLHRVVHWKTPKKGKKRGAAHIRARAGRAS